jgi:hypothetical protein
MGLYWYGILMGWDGLDMGREWVGHVLIMGSEIVGVGLVSEGRGLSVGLSCD